MKKILRDENRVPGAERAPLSFEVSVAKPKPPGSKDLVPVGSVNSILAGKTLEDLPQSTSLEGSASDEETPLKRSQLLNKVMNASVLTNNRASKDPKSLTIFPDCLLRVGVYVAPAGTGSGKTNFLMGLVFAALANGVSRASMLSCFEPSSPWQEKDQLFTNPITFIEDLETKTKGGSEPGLLCIDSVGDPMVVYTPPRAVGAPGFAQPTFAGGLQPSFGMFFKRLKEIADSKQLCIVAAVNSSLLPASNALEGAVEGRIDIQDVAHFLMRDRSPEGRRTAVQRSIPIEHVNNALAASGYGQYRSGSGASTTGFGGF